MRWNECITNRPAEGHFLILMMFIIIKQHSIQNFFFIFLFSYIFRLWWWWWLLYTDILALLWCFILNSIILNFDEKICINFFFFFANKCVCLTNGWSIYSLTRYNDDRSMMMVSDFSFFKYNWILDLLDSVIDQLMI